MLILLILVGGIALLLVGGDFLVRGASGLARSFGVPPLVIGLTVVAFGTSAPELAVNLSAGLDQRTDIAFGNVIGSNLSNIGLILGLTALIFRLDVESRIVRRELPLMLLAGVVVLILSLDVELRGAVATIDRIDGLCLLLFFSIFLYTVVGDVVRKRPSDPLVGQAIEAVPPTAARSVVIQILFCVVGLAGLVGGGQLTITGASDLARSAGLSDGVIGLTVVAVGTSLPELATSLLAAWRGEIDLAVGNVVGSNLFNIFFILGTTATIFPVTVPEGGLQDMIANLVFSVALLVMAWTDRRRLLRREGVIMLVAWVGYVIWRFVV